MQTFINQLGNSLLRLDGRLSDKHIYIVYQVEGFYANKKKSRTKKSLLEWSQKAIQKATG